ncbi:MAG: DUF2817 domain-containing protein [Thermoplasmata archaeon]|nr:MAG: DUF2817 domain-containing protein [Thermoplasmata archaeon]
MKIEKILSITLCMVMCTTALVAGVSGGSSQPEGDNGSSVVPANPVDKYAVLICGDYAGYNPDEQNVNYSMQWGFDEFWGDMVIMYWLLLENGYTDEDIFFLYADGNDHLSARYDPEGTVTDFPATKEDVNMVFGGLAFGAGGFPKVDNNDLLVVYTFDHGGYIPEENMSTLCLIGEDMKADEFAWSVGRIDAGYKMFFMQQCFSGGFIKWLEAENTVILTACAWNEVAWRADNAAGTIPWPENEEINERTYHHGEFNFHFMNALRKVSPLGYHVYSDIEGDNVISMRETFEWVKAEDSQWETPQFSDPGEIGKYLSLSGFKDTDTGPLFEKYAVLICGDVAGYDVPDPGVDYSSLYGYDEFWNDIVLMYWTLLENGYKDENIIILYGNGEDYEDTRYDPDYDPTSQITDFAATKYNVEMVFYGLAYGGIPGVPQMNSNDFLFVYTFDHGDLVWDPAIEDWVSTLCLIGDDMKANEFAWSVGQIDCAYKLFFMQQCHSGGFIEYLDEDNYVVVTACDKFEVAYRADDLDKDGNYIMENEVLYGVTSHHGEFNYYFMNAFRKVTPLGIHVDADITNNDKVSSYEAFRWVVLHDSRPETTQLWNVDLSESIYLTGYLAFKPTKWALLVAPIRAAWELCLKDDISDMRDYLLARGWDDEHILFLTTETITQNGGELPGGEVEWEENPGGGQEQNPPEQDEWWIDGDATWQNVKNALDALEKGGTYEFWHSNGAVTEQTFQPADEDDIIYISFKDHGGRYPDGQRPGGKTDPRPGDEADGYDGVFCTYGNPSNPWDPAYYWFDDELDIELDEVTYYKLVFEMMACHAGEFIPDCVGDMRLVLMSCEEYESSYGVPPYYDLYDGLVEAPTDYLVDDGFVSAEEAHQWEADTMPIQYQNPISDDQIPWEFHFGYEIEFPDTDGDGLKDNYEENIGTDPLNPDSDFDGLWDGWHDDNRNGELDPGELWGEKQYGTDPLDSDTEDDGMTDGWEAEFGIYNGGWQDPATYNEKYAVLISGRKDMQEFYTDTEILYYILRDHYGYTDENIHFLYADGSTSYGTTQSESYGHAGYTEGGEGEAESSGIVDGAATKANIMAAFSEIASVATSNDYLFVYLFDHGGGGGGHSYVCVWDGNIYDDDFAANYVGLVDEYARRTFFMQQCSSGGFIDDLSNAKTTTATACRGDESAWRCDGLDIHGNPNGENDGGPHGEFNYYFMGAFNRETPQDSPVLDADEDGNGEVSVAESFNYAWNHDSRRVLQGLEHPQYDDNGDGVGHDGPVPNGGDGALGLDTYLGQFRQFHGPAAMRYELEKIVEENPAITRLISIGESVEGRDIWALKLSDDVHFEDESEPDVLFFGNMHGNEKSAAEVPLYYLKHLVKLYYTDYHIKDLVDNREIWFVPMLNPDGNYHDQRYNANGVDLNRNFGYEWRPGGSQGPYAFSEPETQAMRDFALAHDFSVTMSYHSSGEIILYPWGCYPWPTPDSETFEKCAADMLELTGYDYYCQAYYLYGVPVYGDSEDWFYANCSALSFAIELGEGWVQEHETLSICQENVGACLYLTEFAG